MKSFKPDIIEYLELVYAEFEFLVNKYEKNLNINGLYIDDRYEYNKMTKENRMLLDMLYFLRRHYIVALKGQRKVPRHAECVKKMDKEINRFNPMNLTDYHYRLEEYY